MCLNMCLFVVNELYICKLCTVQNIFDQKFNLEETMSVTGLDIAKAW
jgi:hypothetical protein